MKATVAAAAVLAQAAVLTAGLAAAEDEYAKTVVTATPLSSGLYVLEGAGGNMTACLGPDGVLLVDDDFAPMAGKIVAKLKELGGGSPRLIVNTHFHYDHTGGNAVFGHTAVIVAPTQLRERLTREQKLWGEIHAPAAAQALPLLTFDDSITLHVNGDSIVVTHLPGGHTDGNAVVFFQKGKVVSAGDLYFSGMYPIFHPEHGGNLEGYVRDLEWMLARMPSDAKVVPGHGPLTGKAEFARYHDMIVASIAIVRAGMKAGRSLAAIQQAGLPAQWSDFSHGYRNTDQWLASIYGSLSAKKATPR